MLPSCELCHKDGLHEGFLLFESEVIEFNSTEMLEYIRYVQRYEKIQPRTYWVDFPFYVIINNRRQNFCMGYRPEDLSNIERIEQKVLKKHQSHLNRLQYFPLDKAEYYIRLKEAHGIKSISTWWPFSDVNDDGVAVKPINNLYDDTGPLRKYDLAVYGSEFTPATDWEKGKSYLDGRGTKGHYFYNGTARETHAEKDFKFDWDLDTIIEAPGPYDFFNSSNGDFGRGKGDSDLNDTLPVDLT